MTFDPMLGDPEAHALHRALTARDWPAAREILARPASPDRRVFLFGVVDEDKDFQEWIGPHTASDPLALLAQGCHAVEWAWEARGAALAKYTSQEQFHLFRKRLKIAEDCLDEVVEHDPSEYVAWESLVTLAMGRGLGHEEAERRFTAAVTAAPGLLGAHRSMQTYLCAKWGGSDKAMFTFARERAAAAPPGSPLGRLIAYAHEEFWLMDDDLDATYFARPEVNAELREAADRSILHPAYQPGPENAGCRNKFAFAFALGGDTEYGRRAFEVLGDAATEYPWAYLSGEAGAVFLRLRARMA
jgi:hypothetical protein